MDAAGAGVLHKAGLVPKGMDMIPVLSNMYTQTLGQWALWLFYVGAIATLYGTIFAATAAAAFMSIPAQAQVSGDTIKIGMITDLSGVYSDIDGNGGAEAVRMAIADMGGAINGKKIQFIVADHQNKADIAASKAREWFDQQGVDMLIGGTNSGASLAMAKVAAEKKKVFIAIEIGRAHV